MMTTTAKQEMKQAEEKVAKEVKTMQNIKIKGYHDLELNCYLFEPSGKAKAVVQIIHGMQEHGGRYKDFAQFLCDNGYVVLASDLRGHGHSLVYEGKQGYAEKDIFNEIIEDQKIICNYLKDKYNLPIYVFGHSFGSFITQRFMQVCLVPEKFVVCGTSNGGKFLYKMAKALSGILVFFGQKDKQATSLERMSFKSYAKRFENGNWLTRDEEIFKKYQADEFCGVPFPVSFYRSLFTNLVKLNKEIDRIPADKKIFLIAGDKDPVGADGKDVSSLYKLYIKKGKNAKIKLYSGARHELVNEINRKEVYDDVLNFYNEK